MFFKFPTWKNLSTQIISASNLSCTLGGLDKKWPLQYLIFSFSITFKTQCHLWLYIFTFDNIYHKYITPLWLTTKGCFYATTWFITFLSTFINTLTLNCVYFMETVSMFSQTASALCSFPLLVCLTNSSQLAVYLWPSHITSGSLRFLIHSVGIILASASGGPYEDSLR